MERKIVEYKAIKSSNPDTLSSEVNKLLSEGWEPHFGLQIAISGNEFRYAQALVKHEEKEPRKAITPRAI